MLPLKPPVSKINLKGITLINFPVVDDDGKILNENSWPKFHGIFNGNVVIVNDSNDKSRLSCLVRKIIYSYYRRRAHGAI